jgi:hypothetical protein
MEINRREWMIGTGALAAAGTAFSQAGPDKGWFDRPLRWVQLAFVEDDPGRYDPGFWLDYFKRIHADAVCLSAGGCVAFYPTQVPLHYRSKFLGNGDAFGEMLAGCRKLGMVVTARVDPHAAHQDVFDAHPDWIAVEASGQPRRHWAMPAEWVTCALGPYNFEFMTSVIEEIMTLYKVDGVFANRWSGSGMCYCQHCQRNFKDFSGLDLPRDARGTPAAHPICRLAQAAPDGFVPVVGWRDPEAQTWRRVLSQRIRGNPRKHFGPDSVCRSPVPRRVSVALAER